MRRILLLGLAAVILMATPLYPATFNGKNILTGTWMGREIEYVEGEILFKMRPGVKASSLLPLLAETRTVLVEGPDRLRLGKVEVRSPGDVLRVLEDLNSSDLIEFAEPNMVDRACYPPNDLYFANDSQWALYNHGQFPPGGTPGADVNASAAWDLSTGSPDILIAIIDSGIPLLGFFLYHPDLSDTSRYVLGEDLVGDGDGVRDNFGHGTHVLGVIAAVTNNEAGVAGVDWNCRILVNQVFDSSGVGTHNAFKNGVIHAVDNGARVINYSGGGLHSLVKEEAVRYADSCNVLLVASAGNGMGDSVHYPGHYADDYLNVIAVSASTCRDRLAAYSNCGPSVCVAAPGGGGAPWDTDDIISTTPNYPVTLNGSPYFLTQTYGYMAGTSMSCGMVTGLASLLLSVEPNFSAFELREIIEESADQVGDYQYYIETGKSFELGHGRIDCYDALVLAAGYGYVYGDASGDGVVTVGDMVYLVNYLYRLGPAPDPLSAGDPNRDCVITVGDIIYLMNYLYRTGPVLKRGCVED
ncbi:MAG: S8 family serine peptidase [Candidatus Zixiibacteriota bacterium]|nr:MAG: S8 family serine peptidase [candidate division Zixibacteria bacterium]